MYTISMKYILAIFYLMNHKILTNVIKYIGFGFARIQIKGILISECLLY